MTGQRDDYTTSCLLDYLYFEKYYKMIATDSSKQQALNADPKAMQKNYFYRKSRTRWKYKIAFYYWRDGRNYFRFFTSTLKLLWIYFALIKYQFKITQ